VHPPAQIFVAVLGASNFTYAKASWTQALADWNKSALRSRSRRRRDCCAGRRRECRRTKGWTKHPPFPN
jgi:transposase